MGTATSVAEFVHNVERLGGVIAAPEKRAVVDAATVAAAILDRTADRMGATSWAGGKRPKYMVKQGRSGDVVIRPRNVGANVALNEGTNQHIIGARGRGTRAAFRKQGAARIATGFGITPSRGFRTRKGKQALSWGGAAHPTPYAFVGGTRGFGYIKPARKEFPPKAAEVWMKAKRRELGKLGR